MTLKKKLQRCIDLIDKHDEMTILEERVFFAQTIQEAQSLLEQQEKELALLRPLVGAFVTTYLYPVDDEDVAKVKNAEGDANAAMIEFIVDHPETAKRCEEAYEESQP